ncbi:hypothetical protein P9272_02640 [Mesorhizobium sp. WSM4976]|uniref:hypothetical protein n=1 Tax=Mesorhizobium sp. WSM4976 TaxID=3038549 RepID=UPI002417E84C|nr:hypothetical protein [Mesorhizobium sp. WSM4976]MDG4892494.1 hypothetical protein [Mesorhizobium sp. WSM4976]
MIGVSLSRWTMSYFAAALLFLIAAEVLMMLGYGFPRAELQAPETLILVHLVAIGWLSLLMCGALFQFVPVLVAQPLHNDMLPLPALASLVAGLAALVLGFLQLAGRVSLQPPFFAFAGALLGSGFALVLWNLARTLWAAQMRPLPALFVTVGLASVAATATLGIIFALVLGGLTAYEPFVALTATGLPLHVIAGLGGWLTFAALGVSYRLLAMFMLAPELERRSTKTALYLGTAALAVAVAGGVLAILVRGNLALVLAAAGILGILALALYGADVIHLYRRRKRAHIELNGRMAAFALASLAASAVLICALLALGGLGDHVGAVVFLVAFGWLSGLGLSQLYKIVAFLTWLECYGPVLGKVRTPRVQDLVVEPRAIKWFWLYFLSVWAGTAALIVDYPPAFQACAAALLIATAGIVAHLVRTRRLVDIETALRLPLGVRRPRLLFSLSHQT